MQTKNFIQFSNISIYRNKILVLKNINISIRRGDFVYLLGQTGSGKSALLETIYAQQPIQQGTLVVDQMPVHQIDQNTQPYLRRKIGLVSHSFPLNTNLSVYQNLEFVLTATDWTDANNRATRIHQVLQLLKITALEKQKTDQLTKKEYVQVLIARALLNSPSILLLDAPVQHLDVQAAQEILRFVYQYAQNNTTTVLFATVNNKIPQLIAGDKVLLCQENTVEEME
ncbi:MULTISPECIES: ATP-binding cassette domain-containing protein [unclassified Aureispira]|uniref:ATP-binding cassette domain-containing protein n=1 Tax=unclassified Aureispira TaxID=2649989 RepID=UPI0006979D25|nr:MULTISPECIES: ATP-binding cassette domain-containing protein [unclassified Aureispira]WMX14525.1 ATP-binding cassette domain-containing protein [Aureispira sp. CCB-E]